MVIMFDTLSIVLPTTILTPGLFGTLQYLACQIEVSFICSIGIFSDRETLELLTVSLSFEDFLPRLTFTCFCFIFVELFHFYLFVTIVNVIDSMNSIFFLLGECHPLFLCVDCHTCPSIFQWNCPT